METVTRLKVNFTSYSAKWHQTRQLQYVISNYESTGWGNLKAHMVFSLHGFEVLQAETQGHCLRNIPTRLRRTCVHAKCHMFSQILRFDGRSFMNNSSMLMYHFIWLQCVLYGVHLYALFTLVGVEFVLQERTSQFDTQIATNMIG